MIQNLTVNPSGFARILRRRDSGGIVFCTARWTGKEIQLKCERDHTTNFSEVVSCPIGSIIEFSGEWTVNQRGAPLIRVASLRLQASCDRSLPDKFHGVNETIRYANRTVDLIVNQEVFDFLAFMSRSTTCLRLELHKRKYMEFITGTLQEEFEGGLADSFSTTANFNGRQYHLSLTSELKLKRLIMAGFENVFEISQTFRNEGVNAICSPEHTLLELYSVGKTCTDMVELVEDLVREMALEHQNQADSKIAYIDRTQKEHVVDFGARFDHISFSDAYRKYVDRSGKPCSLENLLVLYPDVFVPAMPQYTWLMKVIETLISPHLIQPIFLTDLPQGMSPFVKAREGQPEISDRAFLIAGGLFLADIYTDEDDRVKLVSSLKEQSSHKVSDRASSFSNLLEYGIPPTAGFGLGLRRLYMLFRGSLPFNIKETILYPL